MSDTTPTHTNFDRHAIFNGEDRSLVMECINEVCDATLENQLYGLFDGYLYHEMLDIAENEVDEGSFSADLKLRLEELVEKIERER